MSKKGQNIKPLHESEYTDVEVNEFSCTDGLSDEVISLNDEAPTSNEAPVKIFSFNESQNNSNISIDNNRTPNIKNLSNNNANIDMRRTSSKKNLISHKNTNYSSNRISSKSTNISSTPTKVRGLTPSIEGEDFSVKRCYQFRPSTLKKLNQIKGECDNFNIYLNEIIDAAICFYHDSIFNKK